MNEIHENLFPFLPTYQTHPKDMFGLGVKVGRNFLWISSIYNFPNQTHPKSERMTR